MYLKSENSIVTTGGNVNYLIESIFNSLLLHYQNSSFEKITGSNFIFDHVNKTNYSCHKKTLKRSRSYIESPNWSKNTKATKIPKNYDEKCFKFILIASLHHKKINNHAERISNFNPFAD